MRKQRLTHLLLRESGGRLARSRSSVLIALRLSFDVLLVSPPPISLLFLFSSFFWRRYLRCRHGMTMMFKFEGKFTFEVEHVVPFISHRVPHKRALAHVGVARINHLQFRFVGGRTPLVAPARPFALDYDAMWHRAIEHWVLVFEGVHIVFELEHSARGVGPHDRMEIDGTRKRCVPMCRITSICIAVDTGIERAHNLHVLIRVEELGVILYLVTCNFFILMMWCLYVLNRVIMFFLSLALGFVLGDLLRQYPPIIGYWNLNLGVLFELRGRHQRGMLQAVGIYQNIRVNAKHPADLAARLVVLGMVDVRLERHSSR
mmetsp:Transcript_55051/g.89227  ORF Transcript_55051/g.89227 Transcript_55051/m.89227 type:complete len:317 (-) Transcript_55051:233-1183(-)